MGLMLGNEKNWLRMMLDDEATCIKMGVPSNLSDEEKDLLVTKLLESGGLDDGILGETAQENSFIQVDDEKRDDESASDWLIRSAISEMDLDDDFLVPTKIGPEVQSYNLVLDKFYLMTFPNGNEATVKLNRIMENSFGNDYIFENHGGAEKLTEKSNSRFVNTNEFPLPQQFLNATKFNILN